MNLDEFIVNIKTLTQYGNPNAKTDDAAKRIKASVNDSLREIMRNWLWDWLYKAITITLISGTTDYNLDTDVASLIAIDSGNHNYLRHITLKEYLMWHKASVNTASETDIGSASVYLYIGRDATTGARKIRIDDIPSGSNTLTGFAKKKLPLFTDADLGAATSFLPYPDEGLDVLKEFVLVDVYRIQRKEALILPQISIAGKKLKKWRAEGSSEPADDVTTPLPTYYRNKKIGRRNGKTI